MRIFSAILISMVAFLAPQPSRAQGLANAIRLIVPVPAGGTQDLAARMLATPLAKVLGQAVVVENRPGAGQIIGTAIAARAAPDGRTLLFASLGPIAISPTMTKAIQYDPVKDLIAVSLVSRLPFVLVTSPTLEATNLKELLATAKANPGKLEYASAGIGSVGHLIGEMFIHETGVEILHVPYGGAAASLTALLSGDVKMSFTSPSAELFSMVKDGRLRILGVTTAKPSSLIPGVGPIAEVVPNFDVASWYGVMAPAHTDAAVVNRLNAAINQVLSSPEMRRQYESIGSEAAGSSPAEFEEFVASEVKRWGDVIRTAKLEKVN
jgi:tripartite-type tricarboxylate transporter receptor subunit TctC